MDFNYCNFRALRSAPNFRPPFRALELDPSRRANGQGLYDRKGVAAMSAYPLHNRAFESPRSPEFEEYREQRDAMRAEVRYFTAQMRAATALRMPMVYAVLRKEAPVVKIGTSGIMADTSVGGGRFAGQMSNVRLVAITHGGRDEERAVHELLAASRVRMDDLPGTGVTEHFRITAEVVSWINEARSALGLDPITPDEMYAYSGSTAA